MGGLDDYNELDLFEKLVEGCGAFCFASMGWMADVDWLCGEVHF